MTSLQQWVDDIPVQIESAKSEETETHLVLYTDGGCRPTPIGSGGAGVHGYLFLTTEPKIGHGCKGFKPTAKGYINNERPIDDPEARAKIEASMGTSYLEPEKAVTIIHYIDVKATLQGEATNNLAELHAMQWALDIVSAAKPASVKFIVDSRYVLDGCSKWLKGWIKNNWKKADGSTVSNVEEWKAIHESLVSCATHTTMEWSWIKGHSDDVGNRLADYNASAGVLAGLNGCPSLDFTFKPAKGYWNPTIEYNRFFAETRWYYLTNTPTTLMADKYNVYYLGNHGSDDDLFGKPDSTTTYAVLATVDKEPVLEKIRHHQNQLCQGLVGIPVIAQLNNIFKPKLYQEIDESDCRYLYRPTHKTDMYTPSDVIVTKEKTPALLAYRAFEHLTLLEEMLEKYVTNALPASIKTTEITSLIYELVQTKKGETFKLRTDAAVDFVSFNTDVAYTKGDLVADASIVLTLGIDMPKRNFFSAVCADKPKVFVITWPLAGSLAAFRYATVIVTEKSCGIWAGVYSNVRIVADKLSLKATGVK